MTRIVAVILEGEADSDTIAALRSTMRTPGFTVVHAPVSVADIICRVAFETGVSAARIVSPVREAPEVRARFAVAFFAHERAHHTASAIGRAMGKRTASTVENQLVRARDLMRRDPAFALLIQRLAEHFLPGEEA